MAHGTHRFASHGRDHHALRYCVAMACASRKEMAGGIVAKGYCRVVGRHDKRNIVAIERATLTTIFGSTLVNRGFHLIAASQQGSRNKRINSVTIMVLLPGPQATRLPIVSAAEIALEIANNCCNCRTSVIGNLV